MASKGITFIINFVDKFTKTAKDYVKSFSVMESMTKNVDTAINVIPKSIREMQARLKSLEISRDNAFNTNEIRQYNSEINKLENEIRGLQNLNSTPITPKVNTAGLQNLMGFVKNLLATIGLLGSIGLAISFGNESIDYAAKISDGMASVAKTTGMADDKMLAFRKNLQGLNTRTNLEDLLKIGEIGGQLGIVEKDILGFTKTIDKMAIAFKGEFTGGAEEVTQKIGILSNLFPKLIESGMSIPELMGRIGSSMNELGASGAANAPFIADFTQRLAPSMKALNPETILAWAAGLQEMGMTSENAASGVRSFFQYVFKESDNFSKFMKMNKRDMFEMLNTDAGTQKFLTNFSKMFKGATASQMKESLMSLGVRDMQGQDAIQNLIALNEKQGVENKGINRLQELLAISKLSFAENTSLSKEFDKMNNTLAANIEKANKKYDESKLKLGEMLAPLKLQAMELGSILLDKVIGVLAVLEGKKGLFESLAVGAGVLGVTVGILNAKFIMLAASQLLASLTNPFALTIYAGLALAALFTYLYYKSETVRGAFWAIAEGGKVFFEGFYNIGKTFIGGLIDMVMGLVDAIAGLLDGDFSKVGDGLLRSLKGAFSGTVGTVIATIGEGIDKTPKLFNAMGKGFDAGKNDFAKDNAQPLQKPAMGLGDLPNGLSFGAVPGMAKMPQIQNGGSNLLKNKDVPGMPMLPTMPNALPTEDTKNSNLSKGIDTISGGGTKPTTINITIGKLNEKIEIHTNNLDEASVDVEAKLTEMMLRVVNNANQAH